MPVDNSQSQCALAGRSARPSQLEAHEVRVANDECGERHRGERGATEPDSQHEIPGEQQQVGRDERHDEVGGERGGTLGELRHLDPQWYAVRSNEHPHPTPATPE